MDFSKVEKLEADQKILDITVEQLNAKDDKDKYIFKEPSMGKLMIMKHLTPDQFNGVINGDKTAEAAYETKKNELADDKKSDSVKQAVKDHKPKDMKEEDFKGLLKDGIYEVKKNITSASGGDESGISKEDKEELVNLRAETKKQKTEIIELGRKANTYKKMLDADIMDSVKDKEEKMKAGYKSI